MFESLSTPLQALTGTLFTWLATALGSAVVFLLVGMSGTHQRKILSASLGFAAGVMLAASYWSLLAPAVEMTKDMDIWTKHAVLEIVPVTIGFFLGAAFVFSADMILDYVGIQSPGFGLAHGLEGRNATSSHCDLSESTDSISSKARWKRIVLLCVAITVHNIPEGMAVGVGFGAVGTTPSATFENARSLSIGIGLQNFPEGLAVSLPLAGCGFSPFKAFFYGQLSGAVEPIAGVLGAVLVTHLKHILPWAMAFAAGAMVYVVISDVIPEAHQDGYRKIPNWSAMIGFILMMALDVGLG